MYAPNASRFTASAIPPFASSTAMIRAYEMTLTIGASTSASSGGSPIASRTTPSTMATMAAYPTATGSRR